MNKNIILIAILAIIIILLTTFLLLPKNIEAPNIIEGIEVFSPTSNELVSSPLKITGKVDGGGWIGFEGQVGIVKLFDEKGDELALGILTAQGEWMQTKIDFKTTLWFNYPGEGSGKLVFYNENPSGEPVRNKTLTIPVKLSKSSSEKNTFNIYFSQQHISNFNCEEVFGYKREVPKTQAVAIVALQELIRGPTDFEKYAGASTNINEGVKIQGLTIANGVAKVDFNSQLEAGVAGSCRVLAIRSQIEKTLLQFPTVKSVVISINGRTEDILQP